MLGFGFPGVLFVYRFDLFFKVVLVPPCVDFVDWCYVAIVGIVGLLRFGSSFELRLCCDCA